MPVLTFENARHFYSMPRVSCFVSHPPFCKDEITLCVEFWKSRIGIDKEEKQKICQGQAFVTNETKLKYIYVIYCKICEHMLDEIRYGI